VRPRSGRQRYRLRVRRGGAWRWIGGIARTNPRGAFQVTVPVGVRGRVQLYSPQDRMYSPTLVIR
jgi:hypothetical protein